MPKPAVGKHAKTVIIDTIVVLGFHVQSFPVEALAIVIDYAVGTMDGENFVPVGGREQIAIQGEAAVAIAMLKPDGMKNTLFDQLQEILYAEVDKASLAE